jgi:hypothetical protein
MDRRLDELQIQSAYIVEKYSSVIRLIAISLLECKKEGKLPPLFDWYTFLFCQNFI